jgi:uncharacterized protein YjbI with pentapeptide repeats
MPWWFVAGGILLSALAGALMIFWLFGVAGADATLRLEAVRIGLTVVAGTGGAVALALAARKQWLGERTQAHAEALAMRTDHDTTERRITDLYTKAVEQFGAEKPGVQLGGLYALERLGQSYAEYRQPVADVICASLCAVESGTDPREHQVRVAAQQVVSRHLHENDEQRYWSGVRLDLSQARLTDFDAGGCTFDLVTFKAATFRGSTRFDCARCERGMVMTDAVFAGDRASLDELECAWLDLRGARFCCPASFKQATFDQLQLDKATEFAEAVSFRKATFHQEVLFDDVTFGGTLDLTHATFHRGVSLAGTVASGGIDLEGILVARTSKRTWPSGYREVAGRDEAWVTAEPVR